MGVGKKDELSACVACASKLVPMGPSGLGIYDGLEVSLFIIPSDIHRRHRLETSFRALKIPLTDSLSMSFLRCGKTHGTDSLIPHFLFVVILKPFVRRIQCNRRYW